jgi:hypothetical protein
MSEVCHKQTKLKRRKNLMNTGENAQTLMTGSEVLMGALQSIPSSSIDSWARLNDTVPLVA